MKRIIMLLALLQYVFYTHGQNVVQLEYFIDNDAGFGRNRAVNAALSPNGDVAFNVDLSGIPAGFHTLNLRTRDDNGHWSQTSRKYIEVLPMQEPNQVVNGEYFFDLDPGIGSARAVQVPLPDSVATQNLDVITSNLLPGGHILYHRTKDLYGNWSRTARRKVDVVIDTGPGNIVLLEFFSKTDPGLGNANQVIVPAPSPDREVSFTIPGNSIDTLFIRTKDSSSSNWSLTTWMVLNRVLPLTLLSFDAGYYNQNVLLDWKTSNETNTAYFTIQRSIDGTRFISLGTVIATGNSRQTSDYDFNDNIKSLAAQKLYYRLQQVDKDGKVTYSNVLPVNVTPLSTQFKIMPNPASEYITIVPGSNMNLQNAHFIITNVGGQALIKQKMVNAGSQRVNISSLAKGIYSVSIISNGIVQTQRLVVGTPGP